MEIKFLISSSESKRRQLSATVPIMSCLQNKELSEVFFYRDIIIRDGV